ncbi:MAG TPA: hypothetical protein PLV92_29230, partial [Pirellulaceae bacterium]|nr:hypothetical protein [Pirellulaceae bacterium]
MLWEIDIYPAPGQPDLTGRGVAVAAADFGLAARLHVHAARGFLLQGELDAKQVGKIAHELLADTVVEAPLFAQVGDPVLAAPPNLAPPKIDSVKPLAAGAAGGNSAAAGAGNPIADEQPLL